MNIGIYNPYLDTLGGHERYTLGVAYYLSRHHKVTVFWDDHLILERARDRFGFALDAVMIKPNIWRYGSLFAKNKASKLYDILVFVSDGSIPLSFSRRTVVLFEFPVPWVKITPITRFKIHRISTFICNSKFTKHYIDRTFSISSKVAEPGIDIVTLQKKRVKKTKKILSVGRFTQGMNTKKQDAMIGAFKTLCDSGVTDWSFHLAGGVLPGNQDYLHTLMKLAEGYPIFFHPNIGNDQLVSLYQSSSIYWHAAGFGEDLVMHPERAEHFGMATIEAMAAEMVPIVFAGGGQIDILSDGINGFLWNDIDKLLSKTVYLIETPLRRSEMATQAHIRAQDFSEEKSWEKLSRFIIGT